MWQSRRARRLGWAVALSFCVKLGSRNPRRQGTGPKAWPLHTSQSHDAVRPSVVSRQLPYGTGRRFNAGPSSTHGPAAALPETFLVGLPSTLAMGAARTMLI